MCGQGIIKPLTFNHGIHSPLMQFAYTDATYGSTFAQVMGLAQSSTFEDRFNPIWNLYVQQYASSITAILARHP